MRETANEADVYNHSSIWKRAFPERFFALLVTLIIEIPVLLMISGGSDRLCLLVGRRRYQLLIGFLPLSSAISGNCGLQASTLTTRAISHCQVTVENFRSWFRTEVLAATILAFGMGSVLGICGFVVSEFDVPFGVTIFIAQFISIVTAGVTGTLAPLIFTFIFRRDSGKWGGPLETAIQDIVGSFAMVVLSYHVLVFFGPHNIDPSDVCGSNGADGGA
jgi:Mg/Co/Ni transporter MgtE